ncbi:MAG TPA: hypothetical protein VLW85_01980 [Myxococcales bacterium]|nr:hypothetical protein [Myxococcales bacterium]
MRALLPLLLLAACTPNFQAPSDITDLRVLSVQAEPPEAQYDESGVDDVQVRMLVVDPARPSGFALMKWDICAPTDSRRCDGQYGPAFLSGQQSRQGGDEFPAVTISVPVAVVQAVLASDKLGGLGGIRAQFSFSVDDGDPNGAQYADKVLLYTQRGTTPNHNPQLTGLHLTLDGADLRTLNPGDTLCLQPGVQVGVRPLLAADARETYTTTDLQGHQITLTEDPDYSFFVTPGASFDRDTAVEPVDGVAPPDGFTRIEATRGSGTFFVVVRDGRGGESWLGFPWTTPLVSQCVP